MLKDIISRKLITIEPDAKVSEAARLMAEHDVGAVLVISEGKPRGIITDRDIVLRCVAENVDVEDTSVENVLSESVEVASEEDGLYDVIRKMRAAQIRRVPVVDRSGTAIGMVSFGDVMAILAKELSELSDTVTPGEKPLKQAA